METEVRGVGGVKINPAVIELVEGTDFKRDIDPKRHVMKTMDANGDSKIFWDPADEHSTQAAKNHFNELRQKGYKAFSVKANGETDKEIKEFDPQLRTLVMVPPRKGG